MINRPGQPGPLAIGGVGGSGTRVIAEIVEGLGVYLGPRLNGANDNLDFPGLERFTQPRQRPVDPTFTDAELDRFVATMSSAYAAQTTHSNGWGWKNPPNFLFLERFAERFDELRYIHVVRNGLDMALSGNTRQVQLYGHVFGIDYSKRSRVRSALRYWAAANNHAIACGRHLLGDRFVVVNFDALCISPGEHIADLADFVGASPDARLVRGLADRVRVPSTTNRHRRLRHRWRFSAEDHQSVSGLMSMISRS